MIDELKAATGVACVSVRAEGEAVKREGLAEKLGGDPMPEVVTIRENGFTFEAGLSGGQKTGFYLDQRENRRKVAAYAKGREVLSAYCYTGAFEVCAAHAGATKIMGWDSSESALAQARRHHELNPSGVPAEYQVADVAHRLRFARDRRESWDLIILDPPRMVTRREGLEWSARLQGRELLAMKLLAARRDPRDLFLLGVDMAEFRKMVGWAAHDSERRVRILETLGQPADHPVPVEAPECEYLKGLVCMVD